MISALFDLLGMFYQSGDFVQAEWMARSILQAIPDDIVALQFLGLIYYRTERRPQAMRAFGAAAGEPTGSSAPAAVDGNLQASAQCLRAASEHGSTLAGAWYDLGLLLFRLRRYQLASRALQAAVSARPGFRQAQRLIARIARISGAGTARSNSPELQDASGDVQKPAVS